MSGSLRKIVNRVIATDRDLVLRSAQTPRARSDRGLKALSNAANHSMLWLSAAAMLGCRKGPCRRAAFRGIAAIAGASASTNLIGKPLFPRRRPAAHLVPDRRRLSDPPTSSSFPSGHAASAAAFTVAVTMESPVLGLALAPVATAVAYSRVHTGVHWPSDVVVGAALGTGVALATRRWWPLRPEEPAEVNHPAEEPALNNGEGMLVLINLVSGDGTLDPVEWVDAHWPAAKIVYANRDGRLVAELDRTLDREGDSVRALGVAGGDGTVAAVASIATRRGIPLAVLSSGTLNHFAKDIGVDDPSAVVAAVDQGSAVRVDLGGVTVDRVPTRWFLNTASLGGYPDMVRFREKWAPRWGKWPAAAAALVRVLYDSTPLHVEINGEPHRLWVLFVGNGRYAPPGFAPSWRPRLDNGLLDIRYVHADARFSRLRFVLAAITGALHRSHTYVERADRELDVTVQDRPVVVATDGEVGTRGNKFTFAAHDNVLSVYRPTTWT